MSFLKEKILLVLNSLDSFWFKPVDTLSLSIFRSVFSLILLIMYLVRFFDIRIFFYKTGLLDSTFIEKMTVHPVHKLFHFIFSSDALLFFCYLVFILTLLLMVLGVANRLVYVLAFILHVIFLQRNPSIIYGADVIATFWLFYLIFSKSHAQVKWLNYFFKKNQPLISNSEMPGDIFNTIALRLIQIQLCAIYMFTGMEKLKGRSWWDGTAIWEALSFYDFTWIDFSFLLSAPLLSGAIVAFTVLFEIYFPVLVWIPRLKKVALWTGFLFHLGIALSFNIYFFALIMLSAYILFIPSDSLRALRKFFK